MATAADRPVTPRVTARRRATRERLLEAATEVFADKGFGAATVDNVCAAAGFTRGAFYSNFQTLTEVFVELYERRTAEVVTRIEAAAAELGEVTPASVAELVAEVVTQLPDDRRWRIVQAEFTLHALRDPTAAPALTAPRKALAAAVRPLLGPGATAREAEDLARVAVAIHDGLAVQHLLEPRARVTALRTGALQTLARSVIAEGGLRGATAR